MRLAFAVIQVRTLTTSRLKLVIEIQQPASTLCMFFQQVPENVKREHAMKDHFSIFTFWTFKNIFFTMYGAVLTCFCYTVHKRGWIVREMLLKPLPGEKHEAVWQCFCLLINACWLVYKMRGQTGWQNKSKFVHKKKKKRIKHCITLWVLMIPEVIM